jgi:hypothetical protein
MEWTILPNFLINVANLTNNLQVEKRKQGQEIQKAISKAFHNTEKYYAYRNSGNPPEKQREIDLAADWESAGILIKPVDRILAERIALKTNFWLDGGTWSDERIKEAGIQLKRIRAEGMTLFEKKTKQKK